MLPMPRRDGGSRRRSLLPSLLVLSLAAVATSPAGAATPEPRPLTAAEGAAVELVARAMAEGHGVLQQALADDAELRALEAASAEREIFARTGPFFGSTWRLRTPAQRYGPNVAVFVVEHISGFDSALRLDMVETADGWRIGGLRDQSDPPTQAPPEDDLPWTSALPAGNAALPAALALAAGVLLVRRRTRFALAAVGVTCAVLACGGGATDGDATAASTLPRLGELAELREAVAVGDLAGVAAGVTTLPSDSHGGRVARLWHAQLLVDRRDSEGARRILATVPASDDMPSSHLVHARLAFLRHETAAARDAYDRALTVGFQHDELRLEILEALGQIDREISLELEYRGLAAGGSRDAEVYYQAARGAMIDQDEDAARDLFATGWRLRPLERWQVFADPALAYVARQPEIRRSLELAAHEEPRVTPETLAENPVAWPVGARLSLSGAQLHATVGNAVLEVAGGAALAPLDTPVEAAGAHERREADALLAALGDAGGRELLHGRGGRRQMEQTAIRLAHGRRWSELVELTAPVAREPETGGLVLTRLRAAALQQLDRHHEAHDLLVDLAKSDVANLRDPALLWLLSQLYASYGEHELAIRLVDRASRLSPLIDGQSRKKQIQLEADLVASFDLLESRHFDLRYPRAATEEEARAVAVLLESEHERLRRTIPVPPGGPRIEVHLYPAIRFLQAYASNIAILGLYDGTIRVPFLASGDEVHPILASVYSHELAHALIDRATDGNAPKWLHEGLAQHVETGQRVTNPVPALREAGSLVGFPLIESILGGFSDPSFVEVAYDEALWTMRFVATRWRTAGIHRLLAAFARGEETPQALESALGQSLADFDRELWRWASEEAPEVWRVPEVDREAAEAARRAALAALPAATKAEPVARVATKQVVRTRERDARSQLLLWHARYSREVLPVKRALGPLIGSLRGGATVADLGAASRAAGEAVAALDASGVVAACPDRRMRDALARAFEHFRRMADASRRGQPAAARVELADAEAELAVVAQRLAPYGLRP